MIAGNRLTVPVGEPYLKKRIFDFSGGLVRYPMMDNELLTLTNLRIRRDGVLVPRKGSANFGATPDGPFWGLHFWRRSNPFVIAFKAGAPGTIWQRQIEAAGWTNVSSATRAHIISASYQWRCAELNGVLVMTNPHPMTTEINHPQKWDSTAANVTDLGTSAGGWGGTHPPHCAYVVQHINKLFMAGPDYDATVAASLQHYLWYCADNDPESGWSFEPIGDPHEAIVGLAVSGGKLIIFKKDTIWEFVGRTFESGAINQVAEFGTTFPRSICQAPDGIYFVSENGAQVMRNGNYPRRIGEKIREIMPIDRENMSHNPHSNWFQSGYNMEDDEYWVSLWGANGTSNDTCFVYDALGNYWWKTSGIHANCFTYIDSPDHVSQKGFMWADSRSGKYVTRYTGTQDSGVDVSCTVKTRFFHMGMPSWKKSSRRLKIAGRGTGITAKAYTQDTPDFSPSSNTLASAATIPKDINCVRGVTGKETSLEVSGVIINLQEMELEYRVLRDF